MTAPLCRIDACVRPARTNRTRCAAHANPVSAARGTGARRVRANTPIWLVVVSSIERDRNGCWIWQRTLNSTGYAVFGRRIGGIKRPWLVHRLSYETFVGPIPDGLTIDHLCRVPACVNPEHLEPVTNSENLRRVPHYNIFKTHCRHGHAFSPENTYVRVIAGTPQRDCRTCSRARSAAYSARKQVVA